ncbi:FeoB-associated Cys-rich membrane protein [Dysgonomonas sp. 520]|uniref:FeoB-associated Cys-rich membrane protein n=1 Tax=Dysgonomonas sp. 520 TaxID=2302931 RepID=UPI001625DFF0|nr:FeoB-associated Cys-rich membrane protein [Dysgonomonas sp. 520]
MFRKGKIIILLLTVLAFAHLQSFAQRTSVSATINPSEILIGEQSTITLNIKTPVGRTVITPDYEYADTLITGIEVLAKLEPDTTISHDVMTIVQQYIVTSFDSALYNIPYMTVIDGTDTIYSKNMGLKVSSIMLPDSVMSYLDKMNKGETDSINFQALEINDIKDIQAPPFMLGDFLINFIYKYTWLVAIIVLLIVGGIVLFFYLRKKKKGYFFKPEVILPPHIVAIKALDKLKDEKLWQQGYEKEYYTELTDTLRIYIEKRYFIHAMEQTSDETLDAINIFLEDSENFERLKQIFRISDLVKFAKYKPLPNENDLSLTYAYQFVDQTKMIEKEPDVKESDSQSQLRNSPDGNEQKTEVRPEDKNIDEEAER